MSKKEEFVIVSGELYAAALNKLFLHVSFRLTSAVRRKANLCYLHYFNVIKELRSIKKKKLSLSVFALVLTATSSFAGGCSKHNHDANLEAMACQVGYIWDEEAEACVEAPQA